MATKSKNTVKKATVSKVKPTQEPKKEVVPALVKLCLRQMNSKGEVNSNVKFQAENKEGKADIKTIVDFLSDRLFDVFSLQNKIASKGGKSRLFKMTKGGKWYVDIDVITEGETATIVAGLEFSFADLGTEQPKEVLQDVFEAWVLLNTQGTI